MLVAKSWRPNGEDPPLACALVVFKLKPKLQRKADRKGFFA